MGWGSYTSSYRLQRRGAVRTVDRSTTTGNKHTFATLRPHARSHRTARCSQTPVGSASGSVASARAIRASSRFLLLPPRPAVHPKRAKRLVTSGRPIVDLRNCQRLPEELEKHFKCQEASVQLEPKSPTEPALRLRWGLVSEFVSRLFLKRLFSKIEPDPPIRIRSRLIGIRLGGPGSLIGSPSRSPSAIPYWIAVGEREGAPELRHFTHP